MRILALQLKRIGDLVLTTPALAAMRAAGAHVTLALDGGSAGLLPLLLGGSVDAALIYRRGGGSNNKNGAIWRQLLRGEFDACVDFTGRDRSALMTLAARAQKRVIARQGLRGSLWRRWCYNAPVDTSVRSRHTVDFYLDHLAALGLPIPNAADVGPVLRLPPEALARAREIRDAHGDNFIVVHPGSARPEKYWLPERWAEVIAFCQREPGRRCVLTGGKDAFEREHISRIHAALAAMPGARPCADLSGQLDLPALAATLAQASLFVGVDSGPMHLAAAWRRPQVVLFGPTNPFHWRPRHALARVLRAGHGDAPVREFAEDSPGGPMDTISTRAVIDCIETLPAHAV